MRARQSQRTRRKAVGFRPQLETLEDRICPSFSFGIEGHTLLITGDQINNTLQLRSIGQGEISGTADEVALKEFTGIDNVVVHLGDASNTVEAKLDAGIAVSVDAGNGANTIDVEVAQDESPLARKADSSIIAIHTGSGLDTVTVKVADVPDVNVKIDTGGDADTVRVDVERIPATFPTAMKVHTAISVQTDNGAVTATLEGDGTPEPNAEWGYGVSVSDGMVMLHSEETVPLRINDPGATATGYDASQTESVALKLEGRPTVAVNLDQSECVALKLEGHPAGTLMLHDEESVALKFDYSGATATEYDASQTQSAALKFDNPGMATAGFDVSQTQGVSVKLDSPGTTSAAYHAGQTESVALKSDKTGTVAAVSDFFQTESVALKIVGGPGGGTDTVTLRIADSDTVSLKYLFRTGAETVAVKVASTDSIALKLDGTEAVMVRLEESDIATYPFFGFALESDTVTYNGTFLTGAETVALKLDGSEAVAIKVGRTDTGMGLFEVSGTSSIGLTESSLSGPASILAEVAAFGDFQRGSSFFEISGATRIGLTASSLTGTGTVFAEVAAVSDFFNPGPSGASFFEISSVGVRGRKADAELQAVVFGDHAPLDLPMSLAFWPWGD